MERRILTGPEAEKMGKNSQHTQSGSGPGCVWGVLHVLKYHHWRYRLPHRKDGGSKHATKAEDHGGFAAFGKSPRNINAAQDRAMADGKAQESSSESKGSVKSRLKALISDELSKRKGRHRRSSSCPLQNPKPRNDAVQQSDASPQGLVKNGSLKVAADDNDDDGSSSASSDEPSNQEQMYEDFVNAIAGEHGRLNENGKQIAEADLSLQGLGDNTRKEKEVMDAMEMISMNKELFLRMMHDPGSPLAYHFHNQQARGKRRMWSKSISLPSSIKRRYGSNKHKQKEVVNSRTGGQLIQPKSKRYDYSLSMPSVAAKLRKNRTPKHGRSVSEAGEISFIGSSQNLKDHGLDQVERNRLNDLKQRIKRVIKENKKEKQRITRDGILHKVPYSKMFSKDLKKELARRAKESPMSEANNSLPCDSENGRPSMSRTMSLRESLARYNKLYESIISKEAKPHDSEKLSSKKQDDLSSPLRVKKTMGRVFSLPDIRFSSEQLDHHSVRPFSGLQTDHIEQKSTELEHSAGSNDTLQPETEGDGQFGSGLVVDNTENFDQLDVQVHESPVSIVEPCEPPTDLLPEPMFPEVSPSSASTSFSKAEDVEVINFLPQNTTGSFSDLSAEPDPDSESARDHNADPDEDEFVFQIEPKDKAEFNYVRRILDLSGFISADQLLGSWYSDDHPLDPSLVYEEDITEGSSCSCMVMDPECEANDQSFGSCHHLIMFDLINEVLMGVYSKSYSYYPNQFSSLAGIRPMPAGYRVLEEVWSEISWFLSSCPEGVHFLDYAVGKDLARGDGWMNLQFDSECVGLEIEELVFEDILEEFVDECYEEYFEHFL